MTSPLQQKLRINGPVVITANRLSDGSVVHRTKSGAWTQMLAEAQILWNAEDVQSALNAAQSAGLEAVGAYAATMNILPRSADTDVPFEPTACLACLFPASPAGNIETCDTAGILASAVNFAASIAVAEALKLAVGHRDHLRRTLVSYDVWTNE